MPNLPAALAVGTYELSVLVQRPGEATRRECNRLPLTLLPRITTAFPINVGRDAQGTATVNVNVRPQVRPHQRASLLVGGLDVLREPESTSTSSLVFLIPNAPVGSHLARVRVDGIESVVVDRTAEPPVFLDRRVVIT
jgi:hypothetical protein